MKNSQSRVRANMWLHIIVSWVVITGVIFLALRVFPHTKVDPLGSIGGSVNLLIAVVSLFIFRNETNEKNRPIFLNLTVSFGLTILSFVSLFVGQSFLSSDRFAPFYFYQYINSLLLVCMFVFSIVYIVFDTLFNEFKIYQKYLLTLFLVGGFCVYYYHPFIDNPLHAYQTEDIADFRVVDKAVKELRNQGVLKPTVLDVAEKVTLNAWKGGKPSGLLFEQEKQDRIAAILPYIEGYNFVLLLYKPLHLNVVYMNVVGVVSIFIFFGYQYKKDPPQGAYIEKIVFLFLPLCSLEILNYFVYVTSTDYASYLDLFSIAQYLNILNLILFLVILSLRLHFITSIKGKFYERKLSLDAEHITRWRDGIDNVVIRHFFNRKPSN